MSEVWKNERPAWCPHSDCRFLRQTQALICVGKLPQPVDHDGHPNTHRLCLNEALPNGEVFDLQINTTDTYHFRRMFEAVDGRGVGATALESPVSEGEG